MRTGRSPAEAAFLTALSLPAGPASPAGPAGLIFNGTEKFQG